MAISANLVHLYVSMAGKFDFLKFLVLPLCCLYCVVVCLGCSYLVLDVPTVYLLCPGPTSNFGSRDGSLPAA